LYGENVWNFIYDATFAFKLIRDNYSSRTMMFKKTNEFQNKLDETMDRFMKSNGFCCGRISIRYAKDVDCSAQKGCKVKDGDKFYRYNEFTFCGEHFVKFENQQYIKVNDELNIKTSAFKKFLYTEEKVEEMVRCSICRKQFHERCVLFLNNLFAEFRCKKCRNKFDIRFDVLKAKSLLSTEFDKFVTKYLLDRFDPQIPLQIRLLSSMDKTFKVKRTIQSYRNLPPQIGYRNSTIFTFYEDPEGYDICFFSVFIQLYDNEAPEPNRNTAYISYIDSVKLLLDTEKRTRIYQLILLGIFDYLKMKGFEKIFIWSCAPAKNVDYIFPRKPENQQMPSSQHLSQWYQSLIDKGKELDVIESSDNSESYANNNDWKNMDNIPLMNGDLWSTRLAEAILTAEKEALRFVCAQKKEFDVAGYFDTKERIWELMEVQTKGFDQSYFVVKMKNVTRTNTNLKIETIERNWINNRHMLVDFFGSLMLEFGSPRQARFATYVLLHRLILESSICRQCLKNIRLGVSS
jgi:Histone acetylation protein